MTTRRHLFTYPQQRIYVNVSLEIKERELSNAEKQAQNDRESLFVVNEFAKDYFINILNNHIDGKSIGMSYLRNRGMRDDIIKKFQIGYSTLTHDAIAKEAISKGYKKEFLIKTGICYEKEDGSLRDRFWGRIIFPVHTVTGKVVAFGEVIPLHHFFVRIRCMLFSIQNDVYLNQDLYVI